jgi:hypothetical protein
MEEAAQCGHGEVGALLRREGLSLRWKEMGIFWQNWYWFQPSINGSQEMLYHLSETERQMPVVAHMRAATTNPLSSLGNRQSGLLWLM